MSDMVADWSRFPSQPVLRRVLRRLYGSVDDYPELRRTIGTVMTNVIGRTCETFSNKPATRDSSRTLPISTSFREILYATIIYDLAAQPDTRSARQSPNAQQEFSAKPDIGHKAEGIVDAMAVLMMQMTLDTATKIITVWSLFLEGIDKGLGH